MPFARVLEDLLAGMSFRRRESQFDEGISLEKKGGYAMKSKIHLALGLVLVPMILLSGCDRQGPLAPTVSSGEGSRSAQRALPADEGAWQTVDLIWCGDGDEISQETPIGQLRYHVSQDLVFEGSVRARYLLPDYEYLLTIVGHPDLPGESEEYYRAGVIFYDDHAPEPYTGMPTIPGGARGGEEYCDFVLVITDQHGNLYKEFRKALPDGLYQTSFLVKDAHLWTHYVEFGNFDTEVLRRDDVNFSITTQYTPMEQ
jgi:hypothetical protein